MSDSDNSATLSFIVVFKESALKEQIDQYKDNILGIDGKIIHDSGLNLITVHIPESKQSELSSLTESDDSPVEYIEPDSIVTIQSTSGASGVPET